MPIFATRKRRVTAVVAAVGIVAAGGGLALAYWSATGTGVGSATTGDSTDFTVTSTAPVGVPLTPGGAPQSVSFTVANPGTGSQSLSSVAVTIANGNGSVWTSNGTGTGCSAADYTVGTPVIAYGELPGGADVTGTVTITMNDLDTNQDICKGVTAPLYFVAS